MYLTHVMNTFPLSIVLLLWDKKQSDIITVVWCFSTQCLWHLFQQYIKEEFIKKFWEYLRIFFLKALIFAIFSYATSCTLSSNITFFTWRNTSLIFLGSTATVSNAVILFLSFSGPWKLWRLKTFEDKTKPTARKESLIYFMAASMSPSGPVNLNLVWLTL